MTSLLNPVYAVENRPLCILERQAENIWIAYEPVWSIGVDVIPETADYPEV